MIKKGRYDARVYRRIVVESNKKPKELSSSVLELRNMTAQDGSEKVDASSSRNLDSESDSIQSQQLREDSNVNPQLAIGDGTVKPSSCSIPNELGSSPRFIEYWVPAGFSYLQLEKYCEALIKNIMLLSSSSKNELLDFHDFLTKIRECCDHPYILDSMLQTFLKDGHPRVDNLTTDIEASGKFLLLEKLLQDVKLKGLKVVIVFQQSSHSKSVSTQLRHLLDDLLHHRFGEESYVHIYRDYDSAKKRAACDLFNNGKDGKFVMLIEKTSCQSSIKLNSVDLVILFNSDWCPTNDLRCLRKMSIQTTRDHLKVLRLYSPNSVEEKVLSLAKEGTVLDGNVQTITRSIGHKLLLWGATYLFGKLDEFHSHCTSIADLKSLSEDKLVQDVLHELLLLLSSEDSSSYNFSVISQVPDDSYDCSATLSLHGEQYATNIDDDIPPFAVWSSLFDGRDPRWKLLPGSSLRIRKRGDLLASLPPYSEFANKEDRSTSKTSSHVRVDSSCRKLRSGSSLRPRKRKRSKWLLHYVESVTNNDMITSNKTTSEKQGRDESLCQTSRSVKASKLAPESKPSISADPPNPNPSGFGDKQPSCSDGSDCMKHVEETCKRRMRELLLKQKKEIREFYKTKREEKAKLEEEHQLELDLISQGCREPGAEQDELKRYGEKLAEHNREMDMRRKALEDLQRDSRKKEKQLKEKWIALSKKKSLNVSASAVVNDSLLNSDLGAQTGLLTDNAVVKDITMSDPDPFSESKKEEMVGEGTMDKFAQCNGPTPDCLVAETEILSVESDGENCAVSIPREELLYSIDPEEVPLLPSITFSKSATPVKLSVDAHPAPNSELDGNSSTNVDCSKENLVGATVENKSAKDSDDASNFLSGPLESDGENDVMVCGEELDCGSNSERLNEPQPCELSGQRHLESEANLPNKEAQHKDINIEVSAPVSDGDINGKGIAESGSISDIALVPSVHEQDPAELALSRVARSDTVLVQSQRPPPVNSSIVFEQIQGPLTLGEASLCSLSGHIHVESLSSFPSQDMADREGNIEASVETSNGEINNGGVAELGITSTEAVPQNVQEQGLVQLPSSSLISSSIVLVDSQGEVAGNTPLPLEQPVVSISIPSNEIRQTDGALVVSNNQITRMHSSFQLDQISSALRNSSSAYVPLQTSDRQDQAYVPSVFGTNTQSSSSLFQGTSSLRPNMAQFACSDPLLNELGTIAKEEKEAVKIYEERLLLLNTACKEEMDEVRKKYDLFRQQAYTELLQKKEALKSFCSKVGANKVLAETLQYHQGTRYPPISLDALVNAITELPLLQQRNVPAPSPRTTANSVSPAGPNLQVVHHLSDLISTNHLRYPHRAAAPHLRQFGTPDTRTFLTSAPPSQRSHVPHQVLTPVVLRQPDGSACNPVVL